ncbi:MAG TPA: hypothetical protein DEB06_00780, partial [Phycisphaerales bacterium]|nr:hypothetical protein [Phycisphaerales bacterium]
MFQRGDWIVPTVHGETYIAKPPLMYWVQMAIAHARRAMGASPFTDETEVRLAAALAGVAGVLAAFLVGRRLMAEGGAPSARDDALAALGALGLCAGVLYFRSARTGEIDILTAPFVIVAVGALHACWAGAAGGRWARVAVATLAMIGAALAKGPPALLVPGLAVLGGVALTLLTRTDAPRSRPRGAWIGALVGGVLLGALSALSVEDWGGLAGAG